MYPKRQVEHYRADLLFDTVHSRFWPTTSKFPSRPLIISHRRSFTSSLLVRSDFQQLIFDLDTRVDVPKPDGDAPVSPQGTVPEPFTFKLSQQTPTKLAGGEVKIVDSSTFKASTAIAAAEVTVEPGAIRCVFLLFHLEPYSLMSLGIANSTYVSQLENLNPPA